MHYLTALGAQYCVDESMCYALCRLTTVLGRPDKSAYGEMTPWE